MAICAVCASFVNCQFTFIFLNHFFSGLQQLGVEAISYYYPLGPSKGYANRVLFLGAFSHSMLQLRGLGLEH